MKTAPTLFEGEDYEAYKKRLLDDGYVETDAEADALHTDAWYTRRANYRHQQMKE